jgi:hypothetical protein
MHRMRYNLRGWNSDRCLPVLSKTQICFLELEQIHCRVSDFPSTSGYPLTLRLTSRSYVGARVASGIERAIRVLFVVVFERDGQIARGDSRVWLWHERNVIALQYPRRMCESFRQCSLGRYRLATRFVQALSVRSRNDRDCRSPAAPCRILMF